MTTKADKHLKILNSLWPLTENVEPVGRARLVAGLVYKNKLISIGFNQKKSHPRQKKYSDHPDCIWLHAEHDAIGKRPKWDISDCSLYVIRRKKTKLYDGFHYFDTWGLAKPCATCMKIIKNYSLKEVIYSCDELGKFEVLKLNG